MGSLASLIYKDIKTLYYKKNLIIFSLLFFVLLFLLSLPFLLPIQEEEKINLLIVNNDEKNEINENLINSFKNVSIFLLDVNEFLSEGKIKELIESLNYDIVLVIPKNFSENLKEKNASFLDIYIITQTESERFLYLSLVQSTLQNNFNLSIKLNVANELLNETEGQYQNLIEFLIKPVSLNITWFRYEKVNLVLFNLLSFMFQSLFFSVILILTTITYSEFSSSISRDIYFKSFKGLQFLLSKLILGFSFGLLTFLIFFVISKIINIQLPISIELIFSLITLILFSTGFSFIFGYLTSLRFYFIYFLILFIPSFFLLTGLITQNLQIIDLRNIFIVHTVVNLLFLKITFGYPFSFYSILYLLINIIVSLFLGILIYVYNLKKLSKFT